ncbi:hypothetical protein SELMODRAFT_427743 [Selaginella moellendorffii]|uniref:Uncharacterized protein n=1 Tax=Selaginella moellendorffii TaxID=88036 RepID=D8T0K8_SELML|nr:hypothetical protein SELMODRAFT_427743 [Selaginella moellendorffii]
MGRICCELECYPVPRIVRPSEYTQNSSSNAAEAAVVAMQHIYRQQEAQVSHKERFHKSLQYRVARKQYEKRKATKDKIPHARPEAMEITSMGILLLRHRDEYEERGQANQYVNDVWKCAMEMERRQSRAMEDRRKEQLMRQRYSVQSTVDKLTERTVRLKMAWGRQNDAIAEHLAAVARKRSRLASLLEAANGRDFMYKLLAASPLLYLWYVLSGCTNKDFEFLGFVHVDTHCPLYHNGEKHQRRLMEFVKEIIKKANTLDARVLAMLYGFQTIFDDVAVPEVVLASIKREKIWKLCQSLEQSRFLKALQLVHIDKMQREGVVISPLCDCNHGVYPLDPSYSKRCHFSCALHKNYKEYQTRLLGALESALAEVKQQKVPAMVLNVRWKPNTDRFVYYC